MKAEGYLVMCYASLVLLLSFFFASMVTGKLVLLICSELCLIGILASAFMYMYETLGELLPKQGTTL